MAHIPNTHVYHRCIYHCVQWYCCNFEYSTACCHNCGNRHDNRCYTLLQERSVQKEICRQWNWIWNGRHRHSEAASIADCSGTISPSSHSYFEFTELRSKCTGRPRVWSCGQQAESSSDILFAHNDVYIIMLPHTSQQRGKNDAEYSFNMYSAEMCKPNTRIYF